MTRLAKFLPIMVATLCCTCLDARAQQLVAGPPPTIRPLSGVVIDVGRHLSAMGYSKIALRVAGNRIEGTAVKGGRSVQIELDERGKLHVLQSRSRRKSQ